ncbi:MAG: DUF2283 domain-containing protein [Candidatus Kapabacteria bacterium]|nr:DUF2283 domain-containing protein [Ignavibacteriota bacterium]MCW5885763.1 DUF2283 domain-containing protein [Candidatus Kapabacteria bacterium]
MKISYDKQADAMYIELIEDVEHVRTVQLSEDIALDFAKGEILVGIEILDAKENMGKGKIPPVVLDNFRYEFA